MSETVVERFLAQSRAGYRLARTAAESARLASLLGVVVIATWIAWPSIWRSAAGASIALVVAFAALRSLSLRLDVVALDSRAGLRGWLRTWYGSRGIDSCDAAARAWLADELSERLLGTPAPDMGRRLGRLARRPLRLVCLGILILLFLRLIWLPALPDGVLPLAGRLSATGADGSEGEGSPRAGARTEPAPASPTPSPSGIGAADLGPSAPDVDDRGRGGAAPGGVPGAATTVPIPPSELPPQDQFLIPEFVVPASAGGGATAPGPDSPRGGNEESQPSPEDPSESFVRARESALRSRHVPPEEREVVRRWFSSGPSKR